MDMLQVVNYENVKIQTFRIGRIGRIDQVVIDSFKVGWSISSASATEMSSFKNSGSAGS